MAEGGMHPLWPDLQTLEQWKATYLQAWDQSIDELEGRATSRTVALQSSRPSIA
jgi:hypothetical protein